MKSKLSKAISFSIVALAVAHPSSSPPSCNDDDKDDSTYTKLLDGFTTYGFDDGGCFFCSESSPSFPSTSSTTVPLSGGDLARSCQRLCDSDPDCVAFTVGRPATFPAQRYRWSSKNVANCCLEKRHYPPGAFVDAIGDDTGSGGPPNSCQHDVMCWTRYERNEEDSRRRERRCGRDRDVVGASSAPTATVAPAKQCSVVWSETSYTDEEIQTKMDHIREGCPRDDVVYAFMLAEQYAACKAEAYAESVGVRVVVLPLCVYTHVSVDGAYRRLTRTE